MAYHSNHMTLRSDAKLIVIKSDLPIASFSAWFYAGARLDPRGKEGLAHFFEHLLVRRTEKYPNAQDLIREISRHGLSYNATTTHEPVWYFYEGPQEKSSVMIDLLVSGLQTSMISEEDIERERRAISDEIDRKYSNPMQYLSSLRHVGLWPQSSLGHPVLGTKESLAEISLQDIRDFQLAHYNISNATFVYIGNENPKAIENTIEQSLLTMMPKAPVALKSEIFKLPEPLIMNKRGGDQFTVGINFRGPAESNFSDGIALDFLVNYYLSNIWTSRLVQRLRVESGITYWVNGSIGGFRDTGYAGLSFGINAKHLNRAFEIIAEEIKLVKSGEILEEDFNGAKAVMRSAFLRKKMNPSALMQWYGWQAISGDTVRTLDEYEEAFMRLNFEDVQRVARAYLTKENCSVSRIGAAEGESVDMNID